MVTQEWQNEINSMNDSRNFQDAESVNQYAVDIPTLPIILCFSHLIQIPDRNAKPFYRNA